MAETKTFKNPAIHTNVSGWVVTHSAGLGNPFGSFNNKGWDLEVTFTKKVKFKVGDRVNLSATTDNYNSGTVVHVFENMAWVVWDNNQQAVRMLEFSDLRHI